jgi:hypothetical protein
MFGKFKLEVKVKESFEQTSKKGNIYYKNLCDVVNRKGMQGFFYSSLQLKKGTLHLIEVQIKPEFYEQEQGQLFTSELIGD